MKRFDKNFIVNGKIDKVIWTISIPLMLNSLIITLYNLTDGLFVAQLSAEDFAATGFVWPLNNVFISLGIGLGIGATALISQYLGADQKDKADTYANNTLKIAMFAGFIFTIIGILTTPTILSLMGAKDSFHQKSTTYLQISFVGLFFDFIFFGLQSFLNSEGNTKEITKMSLFSAIVNVILDPIFIFERIPLLNIGGLNMGVGGAAWATVIAKFVQMILAWFAVKRVSSLNVNLIQNKLDFDVIKDIVGISTPTALGYSGASFGFTILNGIIQSYGTNTLAAYSMVNRITDLVMQPQMGIGSALTSIIGQNIGAKKIDRVGEIFKTAMIFIIILSVVSSIIILTFQNQLLSFFIKDKTNIELWDQAREYIFYTAFIIFFMGFYSAFAGFFQGIGQTKYSMFMSVGRLWVIRLPIIWFFTKFTQLGATGVWISMVLSNCLICVYAFLVYRKMNLLDIVQKIY